MRTPLRVVAPLCLLLTGCLGGSDGASHPGYLDYAVNDGRVFRWTPSQGETVDLYVEIHDGPGEIPSSVMDRFGVEAPGDWAKDAVDAWMSASAAPYLLDMRSHAAGEAHPPSRTVIHVRLSEGPGSALEGMVELVAAPGTVLVQSAHMEIRVPVSGAQIPASAFRRLVRHEFGHLLGIIAFQPGSGTGHSPDQGDLMFPVITGDELSPADRATIGALYGLEPDLRRADAVGGDAPTSPRVWLPGVSLLPLHGAPPVDAAPTRATVLLRAHCGG